MEINRMCQDPEKRKFMLGIRELGPQGKRPHSKKRKHIVTPPLVCLDINHFVYVARPLVVSRGSGGPT
eukprot:scaffold91694_cov24-Phaeocystis_antarctica.AAC.1